MWICTPSFQTASKACAVLRLNGRNWLSISNDGGFRTWLKEAESRMHEAQNTDLFGSEHIGEQAALAMETQPEKQPKLAPAPEKLDYQAITTEAQFAALLDKLAQAEKSALIRKPRH